MLTSCRVIIVMLTALLVSGFALFHNSSLTGLLEGDTQRIEWYGVFASQIFHPFQTYISESVLLPLIAKLSGASVSRSSWLVLCAIVSFLVMPVLTAIVLSKTKSATKGLLFMVVLFPLLNLQDLPLGFPDPMTIMMLGIVALQTRLMPLFVASFFASTSHFSLSIFSLIGLAVVICCDTKDGLTIADKKRRIYCILLGALAGKIFVGLWHLLFNYHAESRLQWALNYGLPELWNRYTDDPWAFWLTPGITFLTVYGVILCTFALRANLKLVFAGIVVLVIAYVANYLALDGVRIFITAAAASLVYLALRWVDCFDVSKYTLTKLFGQADGMETNIRYLHRLSIAALLSIVWLYTLSAAQWAGFGLNFISGTYLASQHIYWAYFCLALIFWVIAIFASRLNGSVIRGAKTIYLGFILLIVIQWIRGSWWPDTAIAGWLKVSLLALIGVLAYCLSGLFCFKNFMRLLVMAQNPMRRILGKFSI